ncbi:hypothetical protein CK217_31400 [Mesorhizobium loti]|nr:hypothetical protein CK217_31400 [Mesorhizobium loti]PBB83361.1 hypothetical protein CK216_29355 [Mesorhizobium sp. WSM3876]
MIRRYLQSGTIELAAFNAYVRCAGAARGYFKDRQMGGDKLALRQSHASWSPASALYIAAHPSFSII